MRSMSAVADTFSSDLCQLCGETRYSCRVCRDEVPLPPDDLRMQAMNWESQYVHIESFQASTQKRLVPIEMELVEVQIQQVQAHQQ